MLLQGRQARIGIYAGTFDPVHAGHVGFALQAMTAAELDEVCFLPERQPRYKPGAEHYGHRVAMLTRALRPYGSFGLLELVDKYFTVQRTLPQLAKAFSAAQLVLLMGADTFVTLPQWGHVERLVSSCEFAVTVRQKSDLQIIIATISHLQISTANLHIVDNMRPDVSSSDIRIALRQNVTTSGVLPSVVTYAKREWLYATVPRIDGT